jgi:hypothetical protein
MSRQTPGQRDDLADHGRRIAGRVALDVLGNTLQVIGGRD